MALFKEELPERKKKNKLKVSQLSKEIKEVKIFSMPEKSERAYP